MKNALLYNHNAGKGSSVRRVVEQMCAFLEGEELLVVDKSLLFLDLPVRLVELPESVQGYYPLMRARVEKLAQAGAERFICVGGDGTATYVCTAMYELGISIPILGVAAGTANVGPIVSVRLEHLTGKHISQARKVFYGGISVFVNGAFLSLAFNDLVVGDTFLSTIEGKTCNISVRALLEEGKHTPKKPTTEIVTDDFKVTLNGKELFPQSKRIRQIILTSVAHENHYGRAVYGVLEKCDRSRKKGVIALCDHIAVSFEEDGAGVDRFSSMEYLIFGPDDRVELQGFAPEACLVCDGNPYLLSSDRVQVRFEPELVCAITL